MPRKSLKTWSDRDMETIMGSLLRTGVFIAAGIVIAGGILFLIQHPQVVPAYSTFIGEPARLRHIHVILQEAFAFKSRAVIQLGLLILIATPVARVIFSLAGFIIEKDRVYIVITFIVLSVLFYSLFWG